MEGLIFQIYYTKINILGEKTTQRIKMYTDTGNPQLKTTTELKGSIAK